MVVSIVKSQFVVGPTNIWSMDGWDGRTVQIMGSKHSRRFAFLREGWRASAGYFGRSLSWSFENMGWIG
jgi:hypothetical protein